MIEIIIKYITDKGFKVNVIPPSHGFPGFLVIFKTVQDWTAAYNWCVPSHDLRPEFQDALFYEADHYCTEIDQLIAQQQQQEGALVHHG